jgi:hypothetical protein
LTGSKTFRPVDAGARQRFVHWVNFAVGLIVFVVMGTIGLDAYVLGLLLLHGRRDKARGYSVMDRLLREREHDLAREWDAFLAASQRRTMSLAGRRPHRFFAISSLVALFVVALILGERVSDAPASIAIASRIAVALAASAMLWLAFFGLSRRARLVFGVDGVRVRETFVRYSTVTSVKPHGDGVVIERSSPLRAIFVGTSDSETADRLVSLLIRTTRNGQGRSGRGQLLCRHARGLVSARGGLGGETTSPGAGAQCPLAPPVTMTDGHASLWRSQCSLLSCAAA